MKGENCGHKKRLFWVNGCTLFQLPIYFFWFRTRSNIFLLASHIFSVVTQLNLVLYTFVAGGQGKSKRTVKRKWMVNLWTLKIHLQKCLRQMSNSVPAYLLWKCVYFLWPNNIYLQCGSFAKLNSPVSWHMTKLEQIKVSKEWKCYLGGWLRRYIAEQLCILYAISVF